MTAQYHWDLIQRTDEWYQMRLGLLTASTMHLILTPTLKIANNDKTRAHLYELVAQRATDFVEDTYQSFDMERGCIEENYAKDLYSANKARIRDCGFVTNEIEGFTVGFSPDGMVGDDGFVEIKSRKQKLQVKTIIENDVPKDDILQVQTGLAVCDDRKWGDFISYSNGMPMFITRVNPDDVIIAAIKEAVVDFEEKAAKHLETYLDRTTDMIMAPRREIDFGDEIKPSHDKAINCITGEVS